MWALTPSESCWGPHDLQVPFTAPPNERVTVTNDSNLWDHSTVNKYLHRCKSATFDLITYVSLTLAPPSFATNHDPVMALCSDARFVVPCEIAWSNRFTYCYYYITQLQWAYYRGNIYQTHNNSFFYFTFNLNFNDIIMTEWRETRFTSRLDGQRGEFCSHPRWNLIFLYCRNVKN